MPDFISIFFNGAAAAIRRVVSVRGYAMGVTPPARTPFAPAAVKPMTEAAA